MHSLPRLQEMRRCKQLRIHRLFAYLAEIVENMACADADQKLGDRRTHQQREYNQDEWNINAFEGKAPEGTRRVRVLLAPNINNVVKQRNAEEIARKDDANHLESKQGA